MRLLLDTHVVIWWLADDPTLSEEIKSLIDEEPEVYVSPVSVWEVVIKQSLGKLRGPRDLPERILDADFRELAITSDHAIVAARLPLLHQDPFDRMLVAQAQCADLTLLTRDPEIQRYDLVVRAV
jgi:PIN domain nuclease of toxin-antitoxin system